MDMAAYEFVWFQHTAARRRLDRFFTDNLSDVTVSTHSRPKAAGKNQRSAKVIQEFQHTAARRRLAAISHCYQSIA